MKASVRAPATAWPQDHSIPRLAATRSCNVRQLRLEARKKFSVPASLTAAGMSHAVEILNLSRGGVCLSAPLECSTGQAITLQIPGQAIKSAKIVWMRSGFAGVQFDEPLSQQDYPTLPSEGTIAQVPAQTGGRSRADMQQMRPSITAMRVDFISSFTAWLGNQHQLRHDRRVARGHRLAEMACRKQGFSWLCDPELLPDRTFRLTEDV